MVQVQVQVQTQTQQLQQTEGRTSPPRRDPHPHPPPPPAKQAAQLLVDREKSIPLFLGGTVKNEFPTWSVRRIAHSTSPLTQNDRCELESVARWRTP